MLRVGRDNNLHGFKPVQGCWSSASILPLSLALLEWVKGGSAASYWYEILAIKQWRLKFCSSNGDTRPKEIYPSNSSLFYEDKTAENCLKAVPGSYANPREIVT